MWFVEVVVFVNDTLSNRTRNKTQAILMTLDVLVCSTRHGAIVVENQTFMASFAA